MIGTSNLGPTPGLSRQRHPKRGHGGPSSDPRDLGVTTLIRGPILALPKAKKQKFFEFFFRFSNRFQWSPEWKKLEFSMFFWTFHHNGSSLWPLWGRPKISSTQCFSSFGPVLRKNRKTAIFAKSFSSKMTVEFDQIGSPNHVFTSISAFSTLAHALKVTTSSQQTAQKGPKNRLFHIGQNDNSDAFHRLRHQKGVIPRRRAFQMRRK